MGNSKADIRIFGVRHHGPGCARALAAALDAFAPEIVLVEGPPDANDLLRFAGDPKLRPPVALLVYPPAEPRRAVFYPFAVFSPEWQAIRWCHEHGVAARFFDLPAAHRLAMHGEIAEETNDGAVKDSVPNASPESLNDQMPEDPFALLAAAAGFGDSELWWDQQFEQRTDLTGVFDAILEAVGELRTTRRPSGAMEARREAYMRKQIRLAVRTGCRRLAVVCGAWHAPALREPASAQADNRLIAGLPKCKVSSTWIPWSHARLSFRSGYGAGIDSPGWYAQVWQSPERAAASWATQAARLLRQKDLEASAADVIETVRLAESLAALRGKPRSGLEELRESIRAVLCHGDDAPMALIRERLEIGDRFGTTPPEAPTVPLARDLELQQKRLRLKPAAAPTKIDLDLRNENGRRRSELLHRLLALGIPWGEPLDASDARGTFHEWWELQWQVEFAVSIVDASVWGNTVETAAAAKILHDARLAKALSPLAELLNRAMLARLPEAFSTVLECLRDVAAVAADVEQLLAATTPLARIIRYGDVRQMDAGDLLPVFDGVAQRAIISVPDASRGIDDDSAERMARALVDFRANLQLLDRRDDLESLLLLCERMVADATAHPHLRGLACRLLLWAERMPESTLVALARQELSPIESPARAGGWLSGVLGGGATALLKLRSFWRAIDVWLSGLSTESFLSVLPILRRGFSTFEAGARGQMSRLVRRLGSVAEHQPSLESTHRWWENLDLERAGLPAPALMAILGGESGNPDH